MNNDIDIDTELMHILAVPAHTNSLQDRLRREFNIPHKRVQVQRTRRTRRTRKRITKRRPK
jgi:hypothetical protein